MFKHRFKIAIIVPVVIGLITSNPVLALACIPVTMFTAWNMVEL